MVKVEVKWKHDEYRQKKASQELHLFYKILQTNQLLNSNKCGTKEFYFFS